MTDRTPGGGLGRYEAAGMPPAEETERREAAGMPPVGGGRPPDTGAASGERGYRGAGETWDDGSEHREAPGARREPRLLPRDECEEFGLRLQHAVGGFVDGPRDAVEEADHVVEEVVARLTEAVAARRRTLKASWQDTEGARDAADTEQLRLALRDYRTTAERLLSM